MKTILVLGAGVYQVPLIRTAKRMGLRVVVASIPGNYPGFALADKVIYENTVDKEAILRAAREEKADGIAVCGTDVCVPTQGYVCETLGLTGPAYEPALAAQDKAKMKKAFAEGGVRTAEVRYVPVENAEPAGICGEIGYPVIFKAVDSSGSRGITRVNGPEEIPYAYEQVRRNTRSEVYLIEKFLEGEEFGAQAFVYHGELKFILPHGDYVFHGDTGVPIGHFAPYGMPEEVVEDAKEQLRRAVAALGVDNCAINADFILCGGKTYVLEIGARAGATCLVEMTGLYYGFDYYEKILEAALGIEPDFTPKNAVRQPNAEMLFLSEKTGRIVSVSGTETEDSRIVELSMDYGPGDRVRQFRKGPDRIGQIIAVGDTVAEAKAVIDRAMTGVRVEVEEE